MGNISIKYSGTALNSYYQNYDAGNTGGVQQANTKITNSGSDIAILLSPRYNKLGNGAVATGAIFSNSSIPGQKIDISYLFNKTGATIDFTVGGTATYSGSIINTGITYSGKSPTGNDAIFSPAFTVPNPTVDTTSAVKTTCNAVGSYGAFIIVAPQSPPNTTYYTIQSTSVGGDLLVIRLPGNYANGTIGGSFTINPPAGTLVRPTVFNVSGGGTPRWITATLNMTDVTYGDESTYSGVDGTTINTPWTVTGTITFTSTTTILPPTLYIKYGLITNNYTVFGPPTVSGTLAYSTDAGGTYTIIGTWIQSSTNFTATNFSVATSGVSNLNQVIVRVISRQSALVNGYTNAVIPLVYDVFAAYS